MGAEPALFMGRGYTGHEHLQWFNLVNMNGRLYDPVLGRMLSPDNYVQSPDYSQGYNRYAYCYNNPLKFSDPDGDNPLLIAALLVGTVTGTINVVAHWDQIDGNFWKGAGAFGIGFGAGFVGTISGGTAFTAAGGTALGAGGFFAGAIGAGVGFMYSSPFQSIGNNLLFGDAMPTAKEFAVGLGISMATGGTLQGINALVHGRNFLTGNFKTVSIPKPAPVPKLEAPKVELNKEALRAKMTPLQGEHSFKLETIESIDNFSLEGELITLKRPNINGYSPNLVNKTDLFHNFPLEFDDIVVKNGAWANRVSDYSRYNNIGHWFETSGAIDGVKGVYQIGINDKGIIFHRNFIPY